MHTHFLPHPPTESSGWARPLVHRFKSPSVVSPMPLIFSLALDKLNPKLRAFDACLKAGYRETHYRARDFKFPLWPGVRHSTLCELLTERDLFPSKLDRVTGGIEYGRPTCEEASADLSGSAQCDPLAPIAAGGWLPPFPATIRKAQQATGWPRRRTKLHTLRNSRTSKAEAPGKPLGSFCQRL